MKNTVRGAVISGISAAVIWRHNMGHCVDLCNLRGSLNNMAAFLQKQRLIYGQECTSVPKKWTGVNCNTTNPQWTRVALSRSVVSTPFFIPRTASTDHTVHFPH